MRSVRFDRVELTRIKGTLVLMSANSRALTIKFRQRLNENGASHVNGAGILLRTHTMGEILEITLSSSSETMNFPNEPNFVDMYTHSVSEEKRTISGKDSKIHAQLLPIRANARARILTFRHFRAYTWPHCVSYVPNRPAFE